MTDGQNILRAALETPIHVESSRKTGAIADLSAAERVRMNAFRHTERRQDWLRGRRALHALMRRLDLSPDTSKLEFPHPAISLTHAGDLAIAAGVTSVTRVTGVTGVTAMTGVAGVGVDYEQWREVHPRMARWFLSAHEQAWLKRVSPNRLANEILRLWTIKEALFKSCPQNAKLVLADIHMPNPERTTGEALIPASKSLCFRYTSLVLESGVLSLALANRSNDHGQ